MKKLVHVKSLITLALCLMMCFTFFAPASTVQAKKRVVDNVFMYPTDPYSYPTCTGWVPCKKTFTSSKKASKTYVRETAWKVIDTAYLYKAATSRGKVFYAKDDYDRSIIKPIYNSLEEYTEGSCDMLAYPSTVRLDNRMIGFGLKNVPPDNWEPVMVTVMHYTSTRMEYNQEAQRATHFIVDETQVVSRKGTSAEQLNTAVATFRKYGGICTMAMQNITAALENKMLKELFSNCNYKCFLDQGGADANALAQIQELSQTEFNALNSEEVGKGVMVWGKKVVLFDAKISKENELYPLINTNFHEKAKEAEKKKQKQRQEQQESNDRIEEIILQMAELAPVTVRDLLSVLEITQEEAEKQLSFLCQQGYLIKSEEAGNIRYQKAG